MPLVVLLFATGEPDLNLCITPTEIEFEWNQGQATVSDLTADLSDFLLVEKELSASSRINIRIAAMFIRTDVSAYEPYFSIDNTRITLGKISASLPKGFYFGALEHDTGFVRFQNREIMSGFPIGADDFLARFPLMLHARWKNFG
jgi:hypothetical protein